MNFCFVLAVLLAVFTACSPNGTESGVVINGITWAKTNVGTSGTFVLTPETYGNRYTWEEAKHVCPEGWRLPTKEEFQRLIDSGSEWTVVNGIEGRKFGIGDNVVFFPATGFLCRYIGLVYVGISGAYHSESYWVADDAWTLVFNNDRAFPNSTSCFDSKSVRCVRK